MNEEIEKCVTLEINIQDTGPGISEEGVSKLFMDFAKLAENEEKNKSGTGLGLSICKKIVEQMGGKVSCTSEIGKGTEFKIELTMNSKYYKESLSLNETYTNCREEFIIMKKSPLDDKICTMNSLFNSIMQLKPTKI